MSGATSMRRRLLLLLAAGCVLAGRAQAAGQTLTLCFERRDVLPWRTIDHRGLNFELLDEVSRRTGVTFVYRAMPWKRCLEELKANTVDGAFSVSFNPGREEIAAFPGGATPDHSKRMNGDGYMLVRRRGTLIDWDGKELRHVDGRIGVQLGYSIGEFLKSRNVAIDEGSQQADELAQKLVSGRIAAAAFGGADAERVRHGPFARQLEVLPVPLLQQDYYLVLSHALVARDPRLANRVWDAVGVVHASPAYVRRNKAAIDAVMRGTR